jgi:hypothetical protein
MRHVEDPTPDPVRVPDDLRALRAKFAATSRRRERRWLLQDEVVPLARGGDPAALACLAELARDPESGIREDAIRGLSGAGRPAAPHVRALIEAGVVDAALPWALSVVGSPADAELLLPFFERRGLRLRYTATEALDDLGAPASHEGFRLALRDKRLFVRARAMAALRVRCSDPELVEALDAAKWDVPWYRLLTRRYFSLWARGPRARAWRARRASVGEDASRAPD